MPPLNWTPAKASLLRFRLELALAFLVAGMRLWTFHHGGSPLPYYDQWTAEFHNTFLKIAQGSTLLEVLFWPHNEHLISTTKIVTLAGFTLNGYWDVRVLIVAGALARALEAALLFRLFSAGTDRTGRTLSWIACAVVFATPISGYNLLCGLQICFAFVELSLVGSLLVVDRWASRWRSGLLLVGMSAVGLASLGAGVAIPAATFVAHVVGRRPRPGFWPAWSVTLLLAAAFALTRTRSAGSLERGVPAIEHVTFGLQLLSWPLGSVAAGVVVAIASGAGLLLWLRRRPPSATPEPLPALLAVAGFAAVNAAMLAANRAPSEFHFRHWELIALLPLTVWLTASHALRMTRWSTAPTVAAIAALGAAHLGGFAWNAWRPTLRYLDSAHEHRDEALTYYRGLLTSSRLVDEVTGASTTLDDRGQYFFDDPVLRYTPHRGVYASIMRAPLPALSLLGPDILPTRPPSLLGRMLLRVVELGWIFIPAGALLLLIAPLESARRQPRQP